MGISDRAKRKASAGVQQRIDNEKETRSEKSHNKQIADKKIQDKLKRDGNAAVAKATASIGIKRTRPKSIAPERRNKKPGVTRDSFDDEDDDEPHPARRSGAPTRSNGASRARQANAEEEEEEEEADLDDHGSPAVEEEDEDGDFPEEAADISADQVLATPAKTKKLDSQTELPGSRFGRPPKNLPSKGQQDALKDISLVVKSTPMSSKPLKKKRDRSSSISAPSSSSTPASGSASSSQRPRKSKAIVLSHDELLTVRVLSPVVSEEVLLSRAYNIPDGQTYKQGPFAGGRDIRQIFPVCEAAIFEDDGIEMDFNFLNTSAVKQKIINLHSAALTKLRIIGEEAVLEDESLGIGYRGRLLPDAHETAKELLGNDDIFSPFLWEDGIPPASKEEVDYSKAYQRPVVFDIATAFCDVIHRSPLYGFQLPAIAENEDVGTSDLHRNNAFGIIALSFTSAWRYLQQVASRELKSFSKEVCERQPAKAWQRFDAMTEGQKADLTRFFYEAIAASLGQRSTSRRVQETDRTVQLSSEP